VRPGGAHDAEPVQWFEGADLQDFVRDDAPNAKPTVEIREIAGGFLLMPTPGLKPLL
jgi:hypothetical protein